MSFLVEEGYVRSAWSLAGCLLSDGNRRAFFPCPSMPARQIGNWVEVSGCRPAAPVRGRLFVLS